MEHRRDSAGAAVIRGRIYMIGGFAGSNPGTSSVERFDGAWTTLPHMTLSRCLCSTAVIAEKLYVSGGEAPNVPNTVERFDPAPNSGNCSDRRCTAVWVPRSPSYVTDCTLLAAGAMTASLWMQSRAMTPTQTLGKNRLHVTRTHWRKGGQGQWLSLRDWRCHSQRTWSVLFFEVGRAG